MRVQKALPGLERFTIDPVQTTFSGGADEPFRRWYPYLEGYSPDFVHAVIERFAPDARVLLDPFAGTCTTGFVGGERGLLAYLCEVNPVMQFIFRVKCEVRLMDLGEREALCEDLIRLADGFVTRLQGSEPARDLRGAYENVFGESRFFEEDTLRDVLKARTLVDKVESPVIAGPLAVAILYSLIPCSLLKRAGDVRYKTEKELADGLPVFSDVVVRQLLRMVEDIRTGETRLTRRPVLVCEDARSLRMIPALEIDAVITSPPYVNGTNYFRNTKLELWFLRCLRTKDDLKRYRLKAVTAGINSVTVAKSSPPPHPSVEAVVSRLQEQAYDSRIPRMVASYFAELTEIFEGLSEHLGRGAIVAIDIGDSNYGGVHVAADELLAACLNDLGFCGRDAIELRKRRSKNGSPLKQVLLVFDFGGKVKRGKRKLSEPRWGRAWSRFEEDLPHQSRPYSKRNWGSSLHSLCSYQGKLKPAIAHHLVKIFVPKGGSMLDPFSGVGTIPFEGALQGREAYAFDLSPLAYVVSKAKLKISGADKTKAVIESLKQFIREYEPGEEELREAETFGFNGAIVEYYHPETLREILAAKRFFLNEVEETPSSLVVQAACLHILHGNRPYALSRRSHPLTPYSPSGEFEYRALVPRLEDKVRRTVNATLPDEFLEGRMYLRDSTGCWPSEVGGLDAVITSPPFFDSTRFYLGNWLRLWFTGWSERDFDRQPSRFIDERQKESFQTYEPIMRQARERLRPGGVLVFHLGKSRKCNMAKQLKAMAGRWFARSRLFDESVAHCESHGVRDKGTVTAHQYLVLY